MTCISHVNTPCLYIGVVHRYRHIALRVSDTIFSKTTGLETIAMERLHMYSVK